MNCLLKFSAINLYFVGNQSLLDRGENSFLSKNVVRVDFDPNLSVIRAKVKASMKQRVYDIEIYLTSDFQIEKATCKCPRGLEICHHIAAAMFASRYDVSKTDIPCSWVPSPADDNVKSWKELYNIKTHERLTERDLFDHEIEQFGTNIRKELCCGFGWILKDEADNPDAEVAVDVNSLLLSENFETAVDQSEWLRKRMEVNCDEIKLIAAATKGQSSNIDWINVRRFRITASNFGALIGSIKRKRYSSSLYDRLLGQKSLDGIKAIQWGRTHEADGIEMLEKHLKEKVTKTGVWLSNSGMLGASPDGFVGDSVVVEVKCRYKSRESLLSKDLCDDKTYIIWFNTIFQNWVVNENHEYYHQIQGQIHLTNTQGCYLVVWTPIETAVVYIKKNNSWSSWIKEMEAFYIDKFIPFLKSKC